MATELKLKEDIKKLKAAISSKATQEKFKAKLKNQLGILEAELSALQKPAPIKLSRAKQLKAKYKALYGVRFQGIDIEKDADIPAMRIGKRTSQGIKGNQYASKKQAKGHTYYEYRENRIDMKQPPKKYPKLEDGGYMAKGGEITPYIVWVSKDGNKREFYGEYKSMRAANMKMDKLWESGEYKNIGNKPKSMYEKEGFYEDGGMMAKGGQTSKFSEIIYTDNDGTKEGIAKFKRKGDAYTSANHLSEKANKFGKHGTFVVNTDTKGKYAHGGKTQGYDDREDERLAMKYGKIKGKYLNSTKARRDDARFEERGKMADGGYMAKGGSLISIKKKYEENEDENAHSENVVLLAKNFGTDEELVEAKKILSIHNKEGHLSSENGKKRQELHLILIEKAKKEMKKEGISFEQGGMMADGGETEIEEEQMVTRGFYEDEPYEYAKGGNITKGKKYISHWKTPNGEKNYDFVEIIDTNATSNKVGYFGKVVKYKIVESSDKNRIGKIEEDTKDSINKALKYNLWENYADGGYMEKGGRTSKDWKGSVRKEKWGKHDLSKMYENNLDLIADVVDYIKDLQKEVGQSHAKEFVYDMMDVLKNGKITYNDGATLTFKEGGEVNGDNMEMVVSQIKAIKHHAEELSKIVTPSTPIEAWVVAKIERSETDLSDVTHYLDGLKMKLGGKISSSTHRLNR